MKIVLKKFDDINNVIHRESLSHVSMWFDGKREIDASPMVGDLYVCQYINGDAYVRFYIRESYILKYIDEYRIVEEYKIDLPEELFVL